MNLCVCVCVCVCVYVCVCVCVCRERRASATEHISILEATVCKQAILLQKH